MPLPFVASRSEKKNRTLRPRRDLDAASASTTSESAMHALVQHSVRHTYCCLEAATAATWPLPKKVKKDNVTLAAA